MRALLILAVIFIACASSGPGKKKKSKQPDCIQQLIKRFESEEKKNPPRSVWQYGYNGRTVYYVPAICCDFMSDLYDSTCNIIAHPDGGFTGKGDGRAPDFFEKRTNEKLIWQDLRK